MLKSDLQSCPDLIAYVDEIGLLPLLPVGILGWSAEESVAPECRYVRNPDGSFDWPLWNWKGDIVRESGCAYGKFVLGKAAFVSRKLWPHLCNYRRSLRPLNLDDDSIESMVLSVLRDGGSMVSSELRQACGMGGTKMRSRFDSYVARLQHSCYVVTEDFIMSVDRHGREYGWGKALLTTPEQLFGREACHPGCSPGESKTILSEHLHRIAPGITAKLTDRILDKHS